VKTKKVLFITAHPDDESLWCPGLINFLSTIDGYDVYVLCLWDILEKKDQFREEQFYQATDFLGCNALITEDSLVCPLRQIENKFSVNLKDFQVIIAHSPYGDEHEHRHHINVHRYAKEKAADLQIGFSYFSYITPPGTYVSLMKSGLRLGITHLLNILQNIDSKNIFYQFSFDYDIKKTSLSFYKNINIEQHIRGYYAWTSVTEGYMTTDTMSKQFFSNLVDSLECPIEKNIF